MWLLAFSIFAALKWLTWWQDRGISTEPWRSAGYLFAWPGSARLAIHGDLHSRARVLAVSPSVHPACDTSLHAGDSRAVTIAPAERFFDAALWLAGWGHFVILCASFQVPSRLAWKKDLQSLLPFNRKLLWVQSGFTVLTIIAFGVLTLVLHRELLRGDRAALGLACFVGVYWTTRVLVDAFYFSHTDWPKGRVFTMGHILLTSLFSSLALTYLGLVLWHWLLRGN